MNNFKFPINFVFNINSLANDFSATDANGHTIAYVRQKMFKLKEDIIIYNNDSKTKENFRIKADKWIDFSAAYSIVDLNTNQELGKIARKGWRSIWRAQYQLIDQNQKLQYDIKEENAWVKVFDAILSEIPILGALTGYFFNPSYVVTNQRDQIMVRLKKEASFWGRRFNIEKIKPTDNDDDQRIILGLMMMILLERRRG